MANWKIILEKLMESNGESLDDLIECSLTDSELEAEFHGEGEPFTAWTKKTAYFTTRYDGQRIVKRHLSSFIRHSADV